MISVKEAARTAFKNKEAIQHTKVCSCYACCSTFAPEEIEEWTDNYLTPICPKCNIDAVLPLKVDVKRLKEIQEYWFGGKLHSNPSSSGQ